MIASADRTALISSMGWVDHDALWRFDGATARAERIPLTSGARYLSLYSSPSDRFAVVHHFDGARFELSVHPFSDPAHAVARAALTADQTTFLGDPEAWNGIRRLYIEYLAFPPWRDFVLLLISPSTDQIEIQRLEWYDDTYDKEYQGVVDVLELPGERFAVVSVQRSSELILHDLGTGTKTGSVELAGRHGNPRLYFRSTAQEIWASDYDTIVVINSRDRQRMRSARLQSAPFGTQEFIGDYGFTPEEDDCVVARPFRGDVVGINPSTLKITRVAKVGHQPLEVAVLPGGEIVARDWKTGDMLRGKLARRWLAR